MWWVESTGKIGARKMFIKQTIDRKSFTREIIRERLGMWVADNEITGNQINTAWLIGEIKKEKQTVDS